uniref:BTB domain-containing protein n=1 Tax=Rhodnius prolixus TaxID=13249 RepID=T1IG44_RHOPR
MPEPVPVGSSGTSAIFITIDDEVYGVGENVVGFLGIGDIENTVTPIKLDLLCGKHVIGFASGSTHTVAYTKEGELYSWGDNNLGKLGNGTILCRDTPGRVLLPEDVKVIQAACGDRYTAAITSAFKVLHWGDIDWSNGASQTLPLYLEFPEDVQIHSLCCGAFHAVALSSYGQVYTWGCGDMGQLGRRRITEVEVTPRLVEGQITGQLMKEIACTMLASVVLTADGRVYAWGHNRDGELGLDIDIETISSPQQVKIEEVIRSIAAANMGSIITGISHSNAIYKWGSEVSGRNIPQVVQVDNIINAYASCPIPRSCRITEQNIRITQELKNFSEVVDGGFVIRDIGNTLFNNKEYSDLTLRLSDGVIYVHKVILCSFCEHFKSMLEGPWAENGKKEIDLTRYNPQAYRAFVRYIYTGKLDQSLSGPQLIELCDIAESYFESELKKMVIARFPTCLTVENAAELYCIASSQPCEDIKELCCNFVSTRLEAVILTDGFDKLKGDLCKNLVKRAVQIKRYNPTLRKIVEVLFK